jgi:hypothetical protein
MKNDFKYFFNNIKNMRKIYIRHADKQYKNMKSELFKHDPGITQLGVERSRKVAQKLIEQYGEPSKIVSSPFRRARETAMIMNMMLKNPLEEICIDINISEYLGNHANTPLDVTCATKFHNPPHPETFEDMKKRVKKHIDKTRKTEYDNPKAVIWYVTGIKNTASFPCLTCLSVTESPDMLKSEFLIFRGALKHENKSREEDFKDTKEGKEFKESKERKEFKDIREVKNIGIKHSYIK